MAAMIWDEQSQAFVETTNVPMRYDTEFGAWVETTGMAWDEQSQAWTERWNSNQRLYLYNEGDECTDVTGGWLTGYNYASAGSVIKNSNHLQITTSRASWILACSKNKINISGYSKICSICEYIQSTSGCMSFGMTTADPKTIDWSTGVIAQYVQPERVTMQKDLYMADISHSAEEAYVFTGIVGVGTSKVYAIYLE